MATSNTLREALDETIDFETDAQSLVTFAETLAAVWGDDVVYSPPIAFGKPNAIVFLLEKKEKEGEADSERWLKGLFQKMECQNIWLIDANPQTRTPKGKTFTSPAKETIKQRENWITALTDNFKTKVAFYTRMLHTSILPIAKANSEANFVQIVHPSLVAANSTTRSSDTGPEDLVGRAGIAITIATALLNAGMITQNNFDATTRHYSAWNSTADVCTNILNFLANTDEYLQKKFFKSDLYEIYKALCPTGVAEDTFQNVASYSPSIFKAVGEEKVIRRTDGNDVKFKPVRSGNKKGIETFLLPATQP